VAHSRLGWLEWVWSSSWWYYYVGTPQHWLAKLTDAVTAQDYETARYIVDDERISDAASKAVVEAAITHMSKEMNAERSVSALGVDAVEMMAPRIS